jgi:hypothetical protein
MDAPLPAKSKTLRDTQRGSRWRCGVGFYIRLFANPPGEYAWLKLASFALFLTCVLALQM